MKHHIHGTNTEHGSIHIIAIEHLIVKMIPQLSIQQHVLMVLP